MPLSEKIETDLALETLHQVMESSESDTARIAAAKILLQRLAPKEDDEAQKHQAAERDVALAEARGLLAEFAALKLASLRAARALDQSGAPPTIDPAG